MYGLTKTPPGLENNSDFYRLCAHRMLRSNDCVIFISMVLQPNRLKINRLLKSVNKHRRRSKQDVKINAGSNNKIISVPKHR